MVSKINMNGKEFFVGMPGVPIMSFSDIYESQEAIQDVEKKKRFAWLFKLFKKGNHVEENNGWNLKGQPVAA